MQHVHSAIGFVVVLFLLVGLATPTKAQSPDVSTSAQSSSSDGWRFRLAPYAWATSISGTTGVRGIDTDISVSFTDLISNLDGAVMLNFEADRDRWSIITDFIYASLSDSSPTPRGVLFTDADFSLKQILWTQSVGYAVLRGRHGTLDFVGGFRLASYDVELELEGAALPSRDFSLNETWIDPIIGARGRFDPSERFTLSGRGDVGGFNANSAVTWQAWVAAGYEVAESSSIAVGYRALGYDHDRNGFKNDTTTYGPFIGAEFKF